MDGTDAYLKVRRENENKTKRQAIVAADDSTSLNNFIAVKSANHQLFIQRILLSVTTYSAKTITFQDDAGTPVPIALFSVPAAALAVPGQQMFWADFGPEGFPLTVGKNLDVVPSAAGVAGALVVEAYQKVNSGAINTGVAATGQ